MAPLAVMGNDGGTIAKRVDLVKTKKKEKKMVDKAAQQSVAKTCALAKNALKRPICVCKKGKLFSKINVVQALISKTMPQSLGHIKAIKDVKEIGTVDPDAEFPIYCPVVGSEFTGIAEFCVLWGCGCAISGEALRQLKIGEGTEFKCPNCSKTGSPADVIPLERLKEDWAPQPPQAVKAPKPVDPDLVEVKLGKKDIESMAKMIDHGFADTAVDNSIYKDKVEGLFHKRVKHETADSLLIRDCRNGIR